LDETPVHPLGSTHEFAFTGRIGSVLVERLSEPPAALQREIEAGVFRAGLAAQ
jgi:hypothetical protein